MAGSNKFKAELSRAARQRAARDRMARSPKETAKRLSDLDRSKYDFSGFSDADIVRAYQGSKFGDEDYARLTGRPLNKDEPSRPASSSSPNPEPTKATPATPKEDPFVPTFRPEIPEVTIPVFSDRPRRTGRPVRPGVGGDFSVGGDLSQNIGKTGDMTTTIGDGNTFGDGVQLGNDGSVTIGAQSAGNDNSFGASLDSLRQRKARAGAFGRGLQFS